MMQNLFPRFDFRLSATYFIVAVLWILLSDNVVNLIFGGNPSLLATVNVLKGWAFVAATTLALFTLLRGELRKRDAMEVALQNDILERTRTLEALEASEHRFSAIFHGSPVATGISRRSDAHIVDVNDAFAAMFGYERAELIGRTSMEVGLWVQPEKRADAIGAIAEKGYIRNLELLGRGKNGNLINLLGSSRAIELEKVAHLVNMFYDVTEQRKLQEQSHYQALLLANVSDAVISTDTDFNIRSWNPAAEAIYGWSAEEVIGKPIQALLQGEFINTTGEEALIQLQNTGTWRGETTHRRKDGSRVYLMASTSNVTNDEGKLIGIVSVNRDITDLMKAQQEQQAAEQMRLELEKQTELVKMKEDFISIVSHEFRTPLSVIVSSSDLIQNYLDRMPRERQMKHLEVIQDQAKFMTALLDDVLTINKARAGKLDFNPVMVDLTTFCQETLERIQAVDNGKHQFIFEHEGDLAHVRLDVKLLQHILVNLLSNAVKYSPDGGEVRLQVAREQDAIVLQVSDQGIGIPAETLPHLYEPFHRAKNTGDIGGTGLGLAIVKESVDFHKGTISYDSEVGIGTTVTVRLPVASS